jgi:hypothetical protein
MEDKWLFLLISRKTMNLQVTQAQRFGMHQSEANPWTHLLLSLVNQVLAACGELPARQMEARDFEAERIGVFFPDGTERAINRPQAPQEQVTSHSGKQKQHIIKNHVVLNEACNIRFVAETVAGRTHDKKLADEAGDRVPEDPVLVQDTGLQGVRLKGVAILQPTKQPKGGELSDVDTVINRLIAGLRIRVEHAIGGVKRYRIIKDTLRNWKPGFRDLVFETCCGLHNFRLNFRPWHYGTISYINYLIKS